MWKVLMPLCKWSKFFISLLPVHCSSICLNTGQLVSEKLSQLSLSLTLMWHSGADSTVHLCVYCLATTVSSALWGQAKRKWRNQIYLTKWIKVKSFQMSNDHKWNNTVKRFSRTPAAFFFLPAQSKDDACWHMETRVAVSLKAKELIHSLFIFLVWTIEYVKFQRQLHVSVSGHSPVQLQHMKCKWGPKYLKERVQKLLT